jgi:hypothetical protein
VKEKILKLNLITDAGKINTLAGTFADHFHTNVSPGELFRIYTLVGKNSVRNFVSTSLDPDTGLICPKILESTGAYVLMPCIGKTENDVQDFFKNAFRIGQLTGEQSVIWLASTTSGPTDYKTAEKKLQQLGLTVLELPYGGTALPYNVFYQVNPKPATAEFIKNTLNATEVTLPPPGVKIDNTKVDVVVILGGND